MVPHHFFYQLALFVLVWFFVMLHVTGPKPGLTTPPVPAQPKRKRSSEPKPFVGFTHKPPCALCEQAAGELIGRVLACLAEGLGIRATARVFEVDPNTVLHWLVEAAEQLQAFSAYLLCDVHVRQLQLDELYAVLRGVTTGELSDEQAIQRLERSRHWVWTAIDPESKLLLAIEVGPRTLEMAQRVVHHVVGVLAP